MESYDILIPMLGTVNLTATLPRKGQIVRLTSPFNPKVSFQITKTAFSATYGGKLFEIKHEVNQ